MFRLKSPLFVCLIVITILSGCSSGKSAFEHGNYYEAVLTSVNRLRRNDDHPKSIETLRQAYPMAVQFYEDRAKASIASNADFKWSAVVESYATINVMYDEIRRCPGALKVIPNPHNYYAKLDEAKKNAAEENYAAGITAMTFATRDKAKSAYYLFKKANDYVPGYKDVIKMTETARWNATVKVVMEPIPVQAKNISVSAQFFDDKVSEYIHSASINEFVKFYTRKEAQTMKLQPDHIIKIDFDEFVVGQVLMNEKETKLERDSVVVGSYMSPTVTNTGTKGTTGTTSGTSGTTSGTAGYNPSGTTGTTGTTSGTTGSNTSGTTGSTGTTSGTTGTNTSGTTNNTSGTAGSNTTGTTNNTSGTTGTTSGTTGSNTSGTTDNSDKSSGSDSEKVTICHRPPGNTSNTQTLTVSRAALKAHLAHGDSEGACNDDKDKAKDDKDSDKPKDEKDGDKVKDDKTSDDKAKDEKSEDKPKPSDDKDKSKDEKSEDKPKDETAEDKPKPTDDKDKSKDEKPDDNKPKDDKKDDKSKPKDDKSKDKGKKPGGGTQASATRQPVLYASAKNDLSWLAYSEDENAYDTVKIYTTVKATLYHFKKTTTSKGVITFRIIDAKTNALLSVEKMPGEYIWISEWATFNGDERALSPEQLRLTKQREKVPPPAQDLFIEFARPIYEQVVTKIKNFYTGY